MNTANEVVHFGWKKRPFQLLKQKISNCKVFDAILADYVILETLVVLNIKELSSITIVDGVYIKKHYLKFNGIGLHSGKTSSVNVTPAKENRELSLKELI